MLGSLGEAIYSGTLWVALPIAVLAGLISFASPCVLPLVPGYLGYIGALAETDEQGSRRRLLTGVALFITGFGIVFVGLNLAFSLLGLVLLPWIGTITQVIGVVIIIMGLVFIGQLTFLQRSFRPRWKMTTGFSGALLLGITFGLGWTPCIGPTLALISQLSLTSGSVVRGTLLGAFYTLGLGIPFLLVALGLTWATRSVGWVKRHIRAVNIIGGSILIGIGLLMATGLWQALMSQLGASIIGFTPVL